MIQAHDCFLSSLPYLAYAYGRHLEKLIGLIFRTADRVNPMRSYMALAPVDLRCSIITARPAGLGGFDALAVDDRDRGAGIAPDPFAICHHKRMVYPFKAPVVTPGAEVNAMALLGPVKWELGDLAEARAQIEQAMVRANDSAYAPDRLLAYFWKTILESLVGNAEAVVQVGEVLVEIAQRHETKHYLALGQAYVSWARARLGEGATSLAELRAAMATLADMGNKADVPRLQGLLAELEAERESVDEALARIDMVLALAREIGGHVEEPFLHRIRGEILLRRDPANSTPAEEAFLTAIAIAQQKKARSFELRAAISLARLWRDQGKSQQARDLLTPVYGWFTEGFDMPDLKEAKALLDELHA